MTPQEINVACAELSGWSAIEDFSAPLMMAPLTFIRGYPPKDALVGKKQDIPNYHGDASAALGLCELMAKDDYRVLVISSINGRWFVVAQHLFHHTKRFRSVDGEIPAAICECFLRVKGKWKE